MEETYRLTYCKNPETIIWCYAQYILLHSIMYKLNIGKRMIAGTRRMISRSSIFLMKLVVLSYTTIIMV